MPRSAAHCILLASTIAISLAGCDLGTYEARRQQAMANVANRGLVIGIPDKAGTATGIGMMLPKVVGTDGKATTGVPGAADGLVLLYEAPGGKGPMALVGGVPAAEGLEKVVANVTAALQAIAPGAQIQPTDEPNIKRMIVAGPQAFNVGGAAQPLPGKTDVLIITSATHVAIVMFRTTDETGAGFDSAIAVSKASITGAAPLPAAVPMGGAAPMPMPPAGT